VGVALLARLYWAALLIELGIGWFFLLAAILFWIVKSGEVWELYLFAVIFSVAYGGCAASEAPLVAALFGLRFHGLILGVINFGFTIGAAVGPFLTGYIFDISKSYEGAFLVCTAKTD